MPTHEMPAGRPRLLTDALVERAVELGRDGLGVGTIADRLGVSTRTTQRALALARGSALGVSTVSPNESALVASVERAATHDWRAAAWLLERLNPAKWDRARREPEPTPPRTGLWAEIDELAARRRP